MADARVLVVGPTSENLLVTLDRLPDPMPHTVHATSARTAMGGTSAGKALHLVDLGLATTLLTTRGDDATGESLMTRLSRCGIDVRPVVAHGATERHLNLMSARGERVSIYLDPCGEIPEDGLRAARSWAMEAMRESAAIFLDLSPLSRALIPEAAALAREVWVDLHDYDGANPFHAPFIEVADVILMNRDGMRTPGPFLRAAIERGAALAVCTLGADGALGVAADGTTLRIPAVPATVVDVNGAGDAFAAGLMAFAVDAGGAARIDGSMLAAALEAGAAQAARAVASASLSPLLDQG